MIHNFMIKSFKKWLYFQEVTLGSDGKRDNASVRTAQDSQKIANAVLGNKNNAGLKPNSGKKIVRAAQNQIRSSGAVGAGTTVPRAAKIVQQELGKGPKGRSYN